MLMRWLISIIGTEGPIIGTHRDGGWQCQKDHPHDWLSWCHGLKASRGGDSWRLRSCLRVETSEVTLDTEALWCFLVVNMCMCQDRMWPDFPERGCRSSVFGFLPGLPLCISSFGCSWSVFFIIKLNHKHSIFLSSTSCSSRLSDPGIMENPWRSPVGRNYGWSGTPKVCWHVK